MSEVVSKPKLRKTPLGKRLLKRFQLLIVALVVVGAITAIVVAMLPLTTPSWTAPGQLAATSSACGGTLSGPSNSLAPGAGVARFDCAGAPSTGAFTVSIAGGDTPSFVLPSGQTNIGYVGHAAVDCSTSITLISGASVQLAVGTYDLCINYSVGTSTTTFPSATALSWSS